MQEWKESEQRRKQLIREMKTQCRDHSGFPEEFSRGEENRKSEKSTFGLRLILSMMVFLCYLLMSSGSLPIGKSQAEMIRQDIRRQADLKNFTGFAKELQSMLYFSGE